METTAETKPNLPVFPELPDKTTSSQQVPSLDQVKPYLEQQYKFLSDNCATLQEQLNNLKGKVIEDNAALVQRVDRLLTLMNNHMAFIRQIVDLIDNYGDRLNDQEKVDAQQDLQYAGLVDRQNRLTSSLGKLEKNMKEIVDELELLKQKDDEHDKFQWRMMCIVTITSTIFGWLLAGDHLVKLVVALKALLGL